VYRALGFILFSFILFPFIMASTQSTEPLHQILTSVERRIHLDAWQITHRELGLDNAKPWSVRKSTLHGGKQEGVDVIAVESGRLSFVVIPTRGMSVLEVRMGDIRLGWNSPVKEVVHPQFINLQSRGGLGWLEGFNEWMVRCGLEWAGHPGKDSFINNTGDKAEMDLTLHGKIGNLPASEVEVVIDRAPPHRIRIRGRVDERMFYGPKLELWTEISTEPGSASYRIEDTVSNHGAYDQEFELIYHSNYGPPLLEQGSRFIGAVKQITPFNAHAAKSVASFAEYAGPTKGFVEQVYVMVPLVDERNRATVMLRNARADRAVTLAYAVDQLPYFTLWKNTTALEEGYVTGLEPGTSSPANRSLERAAGRLPKLKPKETRKFAIDFTIYDNAQAIEREAARISARQSAQPMQVSSQPIKIE
jgi:hypothetical protein